ncbi:AsnC family transcriptional regulator [Thalassococcus sp. CAU 1522]|uniref:siroheme decarboxylase n=1 Tax=Thalassococcus arenae TaxID=2851652 RepID=A0ABS6NCA9_9RHOB|nr:AsnC family transcriptional regulator [Thalassococcus arenae]MBV2361647.1 AsnC family transcriptional regulator [Thalassococcus arenae]
MILDSTDRAIVTATQGGLPLVARPFAALADDLGLSEAEVMRRMQAMQDDGVIRRIAAAPNHYKLGMTFNGMSVWDVDDAVVDRLGPQVGALPYVTHCYRRPRALPEWPYNLFAMLHGASRDEVEAQRQEVIAILGDACTGHDILYSTQILKKTGLRLRQDRKETPCSD